MHIKYLFTIALLATPFCSVVGQDVRLTVDRSNGSVGLENVGTVAASLKGYSIGSVGGFLDPSSWQSLTNGGAGGWVEANPTANWLSELNRNAELLLNANQSIAMGSLYTTGGHLADVVFEYITSTREVFTVPVHYTGPANDFAVYVDPATGQASLANLSSFITAPTIKGYSILSDSGALTAGSWTSMAATGTGGDGWLEANPAPEHLSELNRNGSTLFASSTAISIGQILSPGSDARDLVFEYYTTGNETLTGSVEYIPLPTTGGNGLRGDFDDDKIVGIFDADLLVAAIASGGNAIKFDLTNDDVVDLSDLTTFITGNLISNGNKLPGDTDFGGSVAFADFLTLSGNFGKDIAKWSAGDFDASGDVGFADFLALSGNFGKTAGGAAASVPEPSGIAVLWFGLVLLGVRKRS